MPIFTVFDHRNLFILFFLFKWKLGSIFLIIDIKLDMVYNQDSCALEKTVFSQFSGSQL